LFLNAIDLDPIGERIRRPAEWCIVVRRIDVSSIGIDEKRAVETIDRHRATLRNVGKVHSVCGNGQGYRFRTQQIVLEQIPFRREYGGGIRVFIEMRDRRAYIDADSSRQT